VGRTKLSRKVLYHFAIFAIVYKILLKIVENWLINLINFYLNIINFTYYLQLYYLTLEKLQETKIVYFLLIEL